MKKLLIPIFLILSACGTIWDRCSAKPEEIKASFRERGLSVVLLIDSSASMLSQGRIRAVKEAAANAIELLHDQEYFGVVCFSVTPHIAVSLAPAKSLRHIARDNLNIIEASGSTDMLSGLKTSREMLLHNTPYTRKHIVLITDGRLPIDYEKLDKEFGLLRVSNITLSAIGFGPEVHSPRLRNLASKGRGVFFQTHDAAGLDRALAVDLKRVVLESPEAHMPPPPYLPPR